MSFSRSTMSQAWHHERQALLLLQQYDQSVVRQPPNMARARQIHDGYATWLRDTLKSSSTLNVKRLEFVGSAYEGLKVGSDIEFDVMVILDVGSTDVCETSMPGFYKLKPSSIQFPRLLGSGGYLSAEVFATYFFGVVQKTVDRNDTKMKLRRHGSVATQVDVFWNGGWYNIDLVPCLEIKVSGGQTKLFVAKPREDPTMWREAFSLMEKNKISSIDGYDNGCRKQCLRILKTMRERDPTLRGLTSYYLKTAWLHEVDSGQSWRQSDMLLRLMDVIQRLETAMDRGYLECKFQPGMNVLTNLNGVTSRNIRDRLRHIRNSQVEYEKMLKR